MDGTPALDLWDLVIEVFHSSPNQLKKSKDRVQRNLLRDTPSNKHTTLLNCAMLVMDRRTRSLLILVQCSMFLRTTKQS